MNERTVSPREFHLGASAAKDLLFHAQPEPLDEVLILVRADGTETEAVLPIAEYHRLRARAARGRRDRRSAD